MHLVVGLGNPGKSYERTRHNLGWMVLQHAASRWGISFTEQEKRFEGGGTIEGHSIRLILPLTWMNQAGTAIQVALQDVYPEIPDLIIVHDDLDLPLASIRIKTRGGPGGHNGLRSVISCLETDEFIRLKIGIGRPPENANPADFVLSSFTPEEWAQIVGMLPTSVDALECLICEGANVAMNRFHVRSSAAGEE